MDDEVGLTPREKAFLEAHPDATTASTTSELRGMGGWLGFLTISLLVLAPLLAIFMTWTQHNEALLLNSQTINKSLWDQIVLLDWTLTIIYCVLSIFGGITLLKFWIPKTIPIVIWCIWLAGPGTALIGLLVFDSFVSDGPAATDAGALLGRPVVYSIIWTIYLLRSRRVKNTYRNGLTET